MLEFILPLILSTSISVRAPNVQPNPFDYEIKFAVQKSDVYYVSREWERELGQEYVDEEYWTQKQIGNITLKERFLNKTSRDLKYNQIDVRYNYKGFSAGYALKHIEQELRPTHNLVVGAKIKDKNIDWLFLSFRLKSGLDFATNFNRLDISTNTELLFKLLQNVDLSILYRYESIGDKKFYQYKTQLNFNIGG